MIFRQNRNNLVFGILTLSSGLSLACLQSCLWKFILSSVLVLKPDSLAYTYWHKFEGIPADVYLFNWTNPEDFFDLTQKPKLKEIGPFKFTVNIEKRNITWNDNGTVTYTPVRVWHDLQNSQEVLNQSITMINFFQQGTAYWMRDQNLFLKMMVRAYVSVLESQHYVTATINEILFEGIANILVDLAPVFPFVAPQIPRLQKVAINSVVNNTDYPEGVLNIKTTTPFDVYSLNYDNHTRQLHKNCSKIQGSTGELNSLPLEKTSISLFLGPLHRRMELTFEEEIEVNGILGYKYSVKDAALDNGTLIPDNECYCAGECIPSGVINMTYRLYDLPFFASLPHFYSADPIYTSDIEGFSPHKENHESYIVIEPNTGIPLKAAGRAQVNLLVQPYDDIKALRNHRKVIFPLFWGEQCDRMPDHLMLLLKIYLALPYVIYGVAAFLITFSVVLLSIAITKISTKTYDRMLATKQHTYSPEQTALHSNVEKIL